MIVPESGKNLQRKRERAIPAHCVTPEQKRRIPQRALSQRNPTPTPWTVLWIERGIKEFVCVCVGSWKQIAKFLKSTECQHGIIGGSLCSSLLAEVLRFYISLAPGQVCGEWRYSSQSTKLTTQLKEIFHSVCSIHHRCTAISTRLWVYNPVACERIPAFHSDASI